MIMWVLCQTKPMRERYAAENVVRMGFGFFLPEIYDHVVERVVPLFRSYLFVKTEGHYDALHSTYGIASVVKGTEGKAAIVPRKEIARLRKMKRGRKLITLPKREFYEGQELKVTSGPFADQLVIYDGMTDEQRVFGLMDFLGRVVKLTFDESQLQAA